MQTTGKWKGAFVYFRASLVPLSEIFSQVACVSFGKASAFCEIELEPSICKASQFHHLYHFRNDMNILQLYQNLQKR